VGALEHEPVSELRKADETFLVDGQLLVDSILQLIHLLDKPSDLNLAFSTHFLQNLPSLHAATFISTSLLLHLFFQFMVLLSKLGDGFKLPCVL
jgi:hypothetical protein